MIPKKAFDISQRQADPCRRIGIGQDNRAAGLAVIIKANPHFRIDRSLPVCDAIEAAIGRIEAVGDIGKEQWLFMVQQRLECVGQNLVRPVADEDLILVEPEAFRDCDAQLPRRRVRIETKRIGRGLRDRLQGKRRRAIRALIRVKLGYSARGRLLAGDIGNERMNNRAPEAAHRDFQVWRLQAARYRVLQFYGLLSRTPA